MAAHHDNILEPSKMMSETPAPQVTNHIQNILNVRNRAILVQRTDRKPVTAVTIAVAKDNIVCWTADYYAIIGVVDDVVLEQ